MRFTEYSLEERGKDWSFCCPSEMWAFWEFRNSHNTNSIKRHSSDWEKCVFHQKRTSNSWGRSNFHFLWSFLAITLLISKSSLLTSEIFLFIFLVCPKLCSFSYIADDVNCRFLKIFSSLIFFFFSLFILFSILCCMLFSKDISFFLDIKQGALKRDWTLCVWVCLWMEIFFTGWLDK